MGNSGVRKEQRESAGPIIRKTLKFQAFRGSRGGITKEPIGEGTGQEANLRG